jgi:serine/threonine-protein kinase
MATVYLAQDRKLGRAVALKVLRPELAVALGGERFLREIEIAAKLSHPHILALYDCGEADGQLYYTMPFVAGESLRDRLSREQQLPLEDALQLTREVADALSYAHSHGVVHRDIKPENILLESGHAVVADFGIARAIAAAGSARLTETGLAVGTPAYMSPEQAAGSQNLDGRSDLYSLGCVLWEMLSGETPYTGPTPQAILAKKLSEPLPRISVVREAVSPAVEAALAKALARTPADRWATASEFGAALATAGAQGHGGTGAQTYRRTDSPAHRRTGVPGSLLTRWLVGGGVLVAAVGGALFATGVRRPSRAPDTAGEALRSVAVLPFGFFGDSTQKYLGDGLTNAVTDALVRVQGLRVPASGRVFAYQGRDAREAGRELGVQMVVTGTVQVAGGRVRVATQLVNVEDGTGVWSHQYDSDMAGVFATQDSIATGVVEALQVHLGGAGSGAVGRGVRTRDTEAYRLYLQARRATYDGTSDGPARAIALLEQALARDSTFADAWVALADAYGFNSAGLPPADVASLWRRAVERGIELDSLNGYAFSLRGLLRMQYDWDWDGARRDMQQSVRLSPASADVASAYANFLNLMGEVYPALDEARRALELDPVNIGLLVGYAAHLCWTAMPDSARAVAERALALDSSQWGPISILAQLFATSGRRAETEREAARMLQKAGQDNVVALVIAAYVYGEVGRRDRAREMLRRLEELSRRQYKYPTFIAAARWATGDRAGTLDGLEEALRDHDMPLPFVLGVFFPGLDGEPRFEAVRRRVFGNHPVPRSFPRAPLRSS